MFKNVSILGRLGMSFGLLLALLFGCAGVGVIGLNTMFSTAQYAVSNDMRLAQRAASVERLVLNERRFEKDMFINLADNGRLDGIGFAPFGKVISGMEFVDQLYSGDGERPDQGEIQAQGNAYLQKAFPNLDYIKTASIAP